MRPLRSGLRLRAAGEKIMVLETSPQRRLWHFALFLVLLAAMLAGSWGRNPFVRDQLAGTVIFLGLMLTALGVAVWQRRVSWNLESKTIEFAACLFFFTVRRETMNLSGCTGILLLRHELLKPADLAPMGRRRHSLLLETGASLYRLYAEFGDNRKLLEEVTVAEPVSGMGKSLAQFLGVPYHINEQ